MATSQGEGYEALRIRLAGGKTKEFFFRFHADPRDEAALANNRKKLELPEDNKGVMVIYSGGTIGSAPSDPEDPRSPQIVMAWPVLKKAVPALGSTSPQAINFRVDAVAFKNPLDSSNMGPPEWVAVAQLLRKYMDSYEGFVIAHGTDTMVYSASALSFMLMNLQKPVILTGSQLSAIGHVRNDAQQNLITAILIANARYSQIPNVPEVCIFFGEKLLRGNRAIKVDADGFAAYETPNFPHLGTAGSTIVIREEFLLREDPSLGLHFSIKEKLDANVVDLVVFPGMQDQDVLSSVLEHVSGLRAVVLRTFGAGNTPTAERFLDQLEVARAKQIVVVNVTQCDRGSVQMGLYETSAMLMKYGVVSGIDMTPAAVLTKLMVLLGDDTLEPEDIPRRIQHNLRGEQSETIHVMNMKQTGVLNLSDQNPKEWFRTEEVTPNRTGPVKHAVLVLHSATVRPSNSRLNIDVYLNADRDEEITSADSKLAYAGSRLPMDSGTLVFDLTDSVQKSLRWGERNSFTLQLPSNDGELSWQSGEFAIHFEV